MHQLIEKRREFHLETLIAFIDYEKAFDKVNRDILSKILEQRGHPRYIIEVIKRLYGRMDITINTRKEKTEPITVHRGNRQGFITYFI